jgi:hypothetical protein
MAIETSTFLRDSVLFIRDYLKTNITDPISGRASGFVMTAYPKREVQYPIITVKNTNIDSSKLGIGSSIAWTAIDIEVRVWARNAKECDDLTEDVVNSLRSAQFAALGTTINEIFDFRLNSTNYVVEDSGDNSIHSKVMIYNYKVILGND